MVRASVLPFMLRRALLVLCGVACAALTLWVLWLMRYGFDFTDEGYALVRIADPLRYPVGLSQFGIFYSPVYGLLGGDVVLLRQCNLLFTLGLAWVFVQQLLQYVFAKQVMWRGERLVLSAGFAMSGLVFFRLWLPTPSDHWLVFQALLVAASGVLLIARGRFAGWALIAVGGWMAFLAKPSSAAGLAVAVALYLVMARKLQWRGVLVVAVLTGLLMGGTALVLDASLSGFAVQLVTAMEWSQQLGAYGPDGLFKIDSYGFDRPGLLILRIGILLAVVAGYGAVSARPGMRAVSAWMVVAALFATVLFAAGVVPLPLAQYGFHQLLVWIVSYAAVLIGMILGGVYPALRLDRERWALVLFLVVLPHVFAFGTTNNYWWMGGLAGIFWVMAGVVFLSAVPAQKLVAVMVPLVAATQLIAAGAVVVGITIPHYQTQLVYQNDYRTTIGRQKAGVILVPEYGAYLEMVRVRAAKAGFHEGVPVYDLTGHMPGLIYALGGVNSAQPWAMGSFPGLAGSDAVAAQHLAHVPCEEVAGMWLLTEPKGPVPVDAKVLRAVGVDLRDYRRVASFETVAGLSGFKEIQAQHLWKPVRSTRAAMAACEKAKAVRHA